MDNTYSHITFNIYKDILNLKMDINGKIIWKEERVFFEDFDTGDILSSWLLDALKPILYAMPLERIDTTFSSSVRDKIGDMIKTCSYVLKSTNDTLISYNHLKDCARKNKRILCLFDASDGSRYKTLYDRLCKIDKDKVIQMDIDWGFDPHNREWKSKGVPIAPTDLIELIEKEQIKKIVSINQYFIGSYLKIGLYLPVLFSHLGIEYVTIDNDIFDASSFGYLAKSIFNCPFSPRYSFDPAYHEHWDKKYCLENVRYIVPPEYCDIDRDTKWTKKDSTVLVLSHCRLDLVSSYFNSILYLLDHLEGDSIFKKISLWYWSLRRMILDIMKLNQFERIHYNLLLHRFFYAMAQFQKFEVIESIDKSIGIEIYGDKGWKTIFPEYYQERYLDTKEMDNLFSEEQYLYLCFNCSITYLDVAGAIYNSIRRNVPFINCPPIAKTPPFEGFRHIEYDNRARLNYLIGNLEENISKDEFKNSMRLLMELMNESSTTLEQAVIQDGSLLKNESRHSHHWREHKVLLEQETREHIDKNEDLLRETFQALFLKTGNPVYYDINKSRFFNRGYVKRIQHCINGEHETI